MKKKEPRSEILYVRVTKATNKRINQLMKKLGYKSKSEFVDTLFTMKKKYSNARNARKFT